MANEITLPAEVSNELITNAVKNSYIMENSKQVALSQRGEFVSYLAEDTDGVIQGAREALKPVTEENLTGLTINPYYISKVITFSQQAYDESNIYEQIVNRSASVIANTFDKYAFNTLATTASGFVSINPANTVEVTSDTFADDLLDAESAVGTANGEVTGWVLSQLAKSEIGKIKDNAGFSVFGRNFTDIDGVPVDVRQSVYKTGTSAQVGLGGDFANASIWGQVGGVTLKELEAVETADGTISLKQRNMIGFLIELQLGFYTLSQDKFIKLTYTEA